MLQAAANFTGFSSWTDEVAATLRETSSLIEQAVATLADDMASLSDPGGLSELATVANCATTLQELQDLLKDGPSDKLHVNHAASAPVLDGGAAAATTAHSRRKSDTRLRPFPLFKASSFEDADSNSATVGSTTSQKEKVETKKSRRASVGYADTLRGRFFSTSTIESSSPPPIKSRMAVAVVPKSSIAHVVPHTADGHLQLLDDLPDADDEEPDELSEVAVTRSDSSLFEFSRKASSFSDLPVSAAVPAAAPIKSRRSRHSSESSMSLEDEMPSFPRVKIRRKSKLLRSDAAVGGNTSDSIADSDLSSSDSFSALELSSSVSSDSIDNGLVGLQYGSSYMPIRRAGRSASSGPSASSISASPPSPQGALTSGQLGFKLSSRALRRSLKDVRDRSITLSEVVSADSRSSTLLVLLPSFEGEFVKKWMQDALQARSLLERLGLRLVGIGPGSAASARFFCSRTGCAFDIFVDPKGKLFRELGCVDIASLSATTGNANPALSYLGGWFHISGKVVLHQQIDSNVLSAKSIAEFLSSKASRT